MEAQRQFLDVPITRQEHLQAERDARRSREQSRERLLEDARSRRSEDISSTKTGASRISRYQSTRNSKYSTDASRPSTRATWQDGQQYQQIGPDADEILGQTTTVPAVPRSSNPTHTRVEHAANLWTPLWLRKSTLILFGLLFVVLIIALLLLWHFSEKNNGFHVGGSTTHYSWTYGPTAVLAILLGLWRQVDFYCRSLTPWDELQKGPAYASRSLLLDYHSPFHVLSFLEAFKRGHVPVLLSISGFVLLKLLTIVSTALLILKPSQVSNGSIPVTVTSKFDPASSNSLANINDQNISASSVYAYYGNLALGLPLQAGVQSDIAYGTYNVDAQHNSATSSNETVSALVSAFIPIMECLSVEAKVDGPSTITQNLVTQSSDSGASWPNLQLTLPNDDVCPNWANVSLPLLNPQADIVPKSVVRGVMQSVYCSSNSSEPGSSSQQSNAYLYTIYDVSYEQNLFTNASTFAGGTFVIASNASSTVTKMTSVLCSSSYVISQVRVNNNTGPSPAITISDIDNPRNTTLPDLSEDALSQIYQAALTSVESLFPTQNYSSSPNTVWKLMASLQASGDMNNLFGAETLISATQATYKGVVAQYAHQSLRTSATEGITGTIISLQDRLHVNPITLWILVGGFGLLLVISTALIFLAPRAVVPRYPHSIAAAAATLARSKEVNRLLRRRGPPRSINNESALAGYQFSTALETSVDGQTNFKIVASEGRVRDTLAPPAKDFQWWTPWSLTPVVIITLALPLFLIAILAVLQNSSNRNHGILNVSDSNTEALWTRSLPTLVVALVAAPINALDTSIIMLAPWVALAKQNASARRSLLSRLPGKMPLSVLLETIRGRHLGACFSFWAAAAAGLLAIFIAGLYGTETSNPTQQSISVVRADTFNLTWPNSVANDNGAAAMVNIVTNMNTSYPDFTYDELVMPRFSLNVTNELISIIGPTTIALPVLRGNLRCDVLPQSALQVETLTAGPYSAYAYDEASVYAKVNLPPSCHLGCNTGQEANFTMEIDFQLQPDGQATYGGKQYDLLFGPNAKLFGNYGENYASYIGDNPPVGCPSLAFTFGQFQLNSSDTSKVTTLICYQEIQQLNASVTLIGNTTRIDPRNPPVVSESSVKLMTNPLSTTGITTFDFRIQNITAQELTNPSSTSNTNTMDVFFQTLLNSTRLDPANFVGSSNQATLLNAINHLYRQYLGQAINANMRTPITTSNSTTSSTTLNSRQSTTQSTFPLPSAETTITRTRLIQNTTSTIILIILLAIMTISSLLSLVLSPPFCVLPCNPLSIAGTMSLLAGSDLVHSHDDGLCECCGKPRRFSFASEEEHDEGTIHAEPSEHGLSDHNQRKQLIPYGAEWMSEKDFAKVFEGIATGYSLGWWREVRKRGRRRRFGVDVGDHADGKGEKDWDLGPVRRFDGEREVELSDYLDRRPEGRGGDGGVSMGRGDRDGRGRYDEVMKSGARRVSPSPDYGARRSLSPYYGGGGRSVSPYGDRGNPYDEVEVELDRMVDARSRRRTGDGSVMRPYRAMEDEA